MSSFNRIDFIIMGVQKSGTTALDQYLRKHPCIEMGNRKEVHYFDLDDNFLSAPNYNIYHDFFSGEPDKFRGECTPVYIYLKKSIKRIYEYNPDIKIIILFRNPIDRAYSHWNMQINKGNESFSFSKVIRGEVGERCKIIGDINEMKYSYVDRGFYARQLKEVWRYFAREQTLCIKQEELLLNPELALDKITGFLGVSQYLNLESSLAHTGKYLQSINESDARYLQSLYLDDIKTLEKLLNWDCSDWLIN